MRFLHSAFLIATLAALAAGDSSSTAVFTQTGFGNGTQVTVCTAQITLPILEANNTEGSGGGGGSGSETTSPTPTSSNESGAAPHLLNHRTATVSMLVALVLAGTLY
ncbi:hypothetical protein LMH87_010840 [Akanthomyces muscarius]|uniref:Uncharacterized protein n=2 Tax=Akanthomyces TaxID=150366 RepID=A0A168I7K8_CORDF|nr:hypothetical protein LMH87_010840 [Akanthomyces muscarius]KAJ4150074.1 hypothetical protein LMH87_010840 [Akanthomyces muscarius]OAA78879.1 hypothetical protein LEL_02365 [Akanthomyces lecanii RCEF 1005]